VAGYGLTLAALWLPFAGSSATARGYLAVHAALLAIPFLPGVADPGLSGWRAGLREIYPLLLVALFWPELGAHYRIAGGLGHDPSIASVDQALFGTQPSVVWNRLAPAAWIRLVMETGYLAYYLVLIVIPVWILRGGRREAVRELVLYVCVVYLGCFLVYAVYPVVGPFHFFGFAGAGASGSALQQVETLIRTSGDSLGTAFPSSHVAGSVAFALLASRWCPRWVAWACWTVAAVVAVAVVYTHHHYAVDALAGAALAYLANAGMGAARARAGRPAVRVVRAPLGASAPPGAASPA
jgi:membrane-associated phospholipid phosphatase